MTAHIFFYKTAIMLTVQVQSLLFIHSSDSVCSSTVSRRLSVNLSDAVTLDFGLRTDM